ncbi:MAG TPA: UDP-N-acetylglucosamine 2-epimerase [Solirubrobacterales bacterium]|nr:UDP-N-acetylglucosamine 2-epimerase [Solirubrobacterales bacterium]
MNLVRRPLLVLCAPGATAQTTALAPRLPAHDAAELEATEGSGAGRIAAAMLAVETRLVDARPPAVLLCGDGPEVAAAALVGIKLGLPQARLDAGVRGGGRRDPTEVERAIPDRLCDLLLCVDEAAVANLAREGLGDRASAVGDVQVDPGPAADAIRAWLPTYTSPA